MHDAVDWKIIDENPFCKVKTQKSSVKVNEFVPREVVDKLMKNANLRSEMTRHLRRAGGCWWRGGRERACLFCDVMAIYATISDR
jgi:hypothetical protein